MNGRWVAGNRFTLLENGEEFFPRVFEGIAAAEHEVLLETFILFEDKVGKALQEALLDAARRGVQRRSAQGHQRGQRQGGQTGAV